MQGVYAIVNTVNWKMYIGSSIDIRKRWNLHRWDLVHGHHHCVPLQRAWTKYGADAFQWNVVEEVADVEQIAEREQAWIDATPRPTRYNTSPQSGGHNRGIVRSEEFKQRLRDYHTGRMRPPETGVSISLIKRGKPLSEDHRQAAGAGKRGRPLTDTQRKALKAGHHIPLPSPEQQEKIKHRYATGESARSIALDTGISYRRVWRITHGLEWKYIPGERRKYDGPI